ncbi:MAG: hypothetical protein ABIE43_00050 [Patescibacteria group bacterium]
MNNYISKLIKVIIFIFLVSFFIKPAFAEEKVNVYFFYGEGCPHCAKEEKFLDKLESENENISIYRYEVWNDRENAKIQAKLAKEMNLRDTRVPQTIIGEVAISGYFNDEITGEKIKSAVEYYTENECPDKVASIINESVDKNICIHGCEEGESECLHDCGCLADSIKIPQYPEKINLPLLGEVKIKSISLPALTVLIAALDGFNPCAMWALLFLVSLLLGMKNKKRMWILGSAFIITSGLVYFLFLTAWLNLFLFLGFVLWIRVTIGLVALGSGSYHLRQYWRNRDGCPVTESKKRQIFFSKLKDIVKKEKFWLALAGIILLASAVNLVELLCSAGLPAVYTQVLVMSNLASWQYYSYLLFYIFIFILDDLLIFILAMATLQMKAISSRYTRWSGLIGGILMLIIGILLLFKPGWLMFG